MIENAMIMNTYNEDDDVWSWRLSVDVCRRVFALEDFRARDEAESLGIHVHSFRNSIPFHIVQLLQNHHKNKKNTQKTMNTSDRDQQIVQAFTASLRGDVPPPDQDPAITSVVEQLIAAREDHAVKVNIAVNSPFMFRG